MSLIRSRLLRGLTISSIYMLGVLGIIATSGGGGGDDDGCNCAPSQSCPDPFDIDIGPVQSVALALDGSGAVYFGGQFSWFWDSIGGCTTTDVMRLNRTGNMDRCFKLPPGFEGDRIYSVAAATDGSGDMFTYLVKKNSSGTYDTYFVRLNSDGSMDANFTAPVIGTANQVISLYAIVPTVDGSGDVYLGGHYTGSRLVRINSDGSRDIGLFGPISTVYSITLATDGSGDIYAGGYGIDSEGLSYGTVVRFNSDGSLDNDFSVGNGFNRSVESIALAPDGSGDIYVGGSFTDYNGSPSNRIARLNDDGSLDSDFAIGTGFEDREAWELSTTVYDIAPAMDGSGDLYVGGIFEKYDGAAVSGIVRLNNDGSRDAGFEVGTGFRLGDSWLHGTVLDITPATDGTGYVYVGGYFSHYNDQSTFYDQEIAPITRLFTNGTLDGSFQAYGAGRCDF